MSGSDYPKRKLSHDNYKTDEWILKMFHGWFDPCPLDPEWKQDGLLRAWKRNTFVNPPYSNPLPWVRRAIQDNKEYGFTIVMLLKHDSSTEWYRLLHEAGAKFLLVSGRLKHQTGKGAAFPSVLAVLA
ncbi:MAG: DNA N-6-adenine-methyltransferase [Circular genetic element sp.]|nr:MAG: DNA N-6-adenine-methyltransferase [Circular genetic element sp.]